MRTFSGLLCLLMIGTAVRAEAPAQDMRQQDHISVDQLKRALSLAAEDAMADRESKDKTREYIIKRWLQDREIDEADYKESLGHALDSWYANNRDWRKIAPEIWAKLNEADRGRIKLGIDPGLIYAAPTARGTGGANN